MKASGRSMNSEQEAVRDMHRKLRSRVRRLAGKKSMALSCTESKEVVALQKAVNELEKFEQEHPECR